MTLPLDQKPGAVFFDGHNRLRGQADQLTERVGRLSRLTIIDVVGADPGLVEFLTHLDRANIIVRDRTSATTLYAFRWVSGYANGAEIRLQGMLQGR